MSEQLTKGERKILSNLLMHTQDIEIRDLAKSLKWKTHRVDSIIQALKQREYIHVRSYDKIRYNLTEEGRQYHREGIPEIRLFKAVKNLGGNALLDDAISNAKLDSQTSRIALSWARKNDWIDIRKQDGKTFLLLLVNKIESPLPNLLTMITEQNYEETENMTYQFIPLVNRQMVLIESSRKVIYVRIDNFQRSKLRHLLDSEDEEIGNLTRKMIASGSWRNERFRPYNVESIPPVTNRGKKHPYAEFNDWLKEILVGMGFTEWFGPYVETEFWNNDTLFVPQDHVAREVQDQFRVGEPYSHGTIFDRKYYNAVKSVHEDGGDTGSIGWQAPFSREIAERLCLRAHTTPVSMRYLSEHRESPQKMFIVDRNFRSESLSARHAQEFNQCEGIIMDKGLNLRDLMGYLTTICHSVGIKKIKFKPGQFPFTEPSVECFAKHDTLGWIEVAPGGIFRPEVTRPLGIKDSVLAWGIGSGRLYMAAMDIGDIRDLYSRDLKWLRRKYFVR